MNARSLTVGLLFLTSAAMGQGTPLIPGGLGLDTWTRGLGIDAGTQGPPGLFVIYRLVDFTANKARDQGGNVLPIPGLRIGAAANALALFYTAKRPGAPYLNAAISLPLAVVSLNSNLQPTALDNTGLADLFVAPLRVGWRRPHYDVVTSYSIYVPTGHWDAQDQASVGRGYWINQFSLGGAVYLDIARHHRGSVLVSMERNGTRRGTDSRRGNLLNVQGGAGTTVYTNVVAGFAGYALWQVSDDKGADLNLEFIRGHTRAFGLGPEVDVIIPKLRARVDVRAEWDFGVVAHPQGFLFVIGAQRLAWMPPIKTGASPRPGSSDRPGSRP